MADADRTSNGPFTSPLTWRTLKVPPVRDERLSGRDQYFLVRIWRTSAG